MLPSAMLLDLRRVDNLILGQEFANSIALITLELQDLAHVVVLDHSAVAALGLLYGLEDLLEIQQHIKALDRGDALAAVALLNRILALP